MRVLLDTHAWAWSLTQSHHLSPIARQALSDANGVLVSTISLFEIGQKVRIGKWPEMTPHLCRLPDLLKEQGGRFLPLSAEASLLAATLDWAHRDPFDRFIAATAITERLPIISTDSIFDNLADHPRWIGRIW